MRRIENSGIPTTICQKTAPTRKLNQHDSEPLLQCTAPSPPTSCRRGYCLAGSAPQSANIGSARVNSARSLLPHPANTTNCPLSPVMAKKKRAKKTSTAELPIEESMEELQQIVESLEGGQEPLDESLKKFERGMYLLRNCHQQLDAAASKIELLTGFDADGNPVTTEFDGTATYSSSFTETADGDDEEEDSTLF